LFQFAGGTEPIAKRLAGPDALARLVPGHRLSWLWPAGFAAAILYGSLIPFDIDPTTYRWENLFSVLRLRLIVGSAEDIITNLFVYVPLGLALVLCGTDGSLSRRCRAPLAVVVGATLSLLAETLQTGMAGRVGSWLDVALNTVGTGLGAVLGIAGGSMVGKTLHGLRHQLRERPLTAWASLLTIGLLLYDLMPFDLVTSTSGLYTSFGRARLGLSTPRPVAFGEPPLALMMNQLCGAFWFGALAYLLALGGRLSGRHPAVAVGSAIKHACILAVLVELMQLFTCSHSFDLAALALRMLAAALGAWCAMLLPHWRSVPLHIPPGDCAAGAECCSAGPRARRRPTLDSIAPSTSTPPTRGGAAMGCPQSATHSAEYGINVNQLPACVAPTGVLTALAGIQVFALFASAAQLDLWSFQALSLNRMHWMPFQAMWLGSMNTAFAQALSAAVTYGVLALTLIAVLHRLSIRRYGLLTAMTVTLLAGAVEAVRAADLTRVADITGPTLAMLSAIGAWRLYELLWAPPPTSVSSI
jgi:VanZ family protein